MARTPSRDRDSPIEYTGEAHLVTVSCTECGDTVEVSESAAEAGGPITCDGCTHDCLDHLSLMQYELEKCDGSDILPYSCDICGKCFTFNISTGKHTEGVHW